jgi:hypothetical protein
MLLPGLNVRSERRSQCLGFDLQTPYPNVPWRFKDTAECEDLEARNTPNPKLCKPRRVVSYAVRSALRFTIYFSTGAVYDQTFGSIPLEVAPEKHNSSRLEWTALRN